MIKTASPLAKDNMGLAYAVVQRIGLDNGVSIQDSEEFSDACIGLINAEMKYDPEKAKFSTFAYILCYREVVRGKQRRYKKRHFSFGCLNDKHLTEKLIDKHLFDLRIPNASSLLALLIHHKNESSPVRYLSDLLLGEWRSEAEVRR